MYFWLFNLAGVGIAGWALMIFLPGWSFTKWIASSAIFPVYVAVLYTAGIVPLIASRPGIVTEFGSPDDVLRLLASADVALVLPCQIDETGREIMRFAFCTPSLQNVMKVPTIPESRLILAETA